MEEQKEMENHMISCGFIVGDRVQRTDSEGGPKGKVTNVRREVMRSSLKPSTSEAPGLAVTVLWDNGTVSHFIPEGLKKV